MSIRLMFDAGGLDAQATGFIAARMGAVIASSAEKMSVLMLQLQAHVVSEHLSGRPGLNQITGTLASSIHTESTKVDGSVITGHVAGAGGPAWYGRVHEQPDGPVHIPERVPVKAKALHWVSPEGFSVFAMHAAAFDMPKRAFMSTSLDEMQGDIVDGLRAAVVRGLTA